MTGSKSNMALEIERKFLVLDDAWRGQAKKVIPMAQGYLNDQASMSAGAAGGVVQQVSVRVRLEGDEARLNFKSRAIGHTRQEFDYPIPAQDARALLDLCVGGMIDKRRHLVEHLGHLWEIDEFLGENAGLVVAEVELDAGDEWFERPAWLGVEVTDSTRYYNLALASRPYSQWSETERAATDLESDTCS
jgi:adenylate cyclase